MRGINKVTLVGHLGRDPEVRYMPSGGAVATVSLATTDSWRDKQTGEMKEQTEWHRCVFFNRLGEIAGEYLKKGSLVYVEGQLRTNKWQGQDGQDRYTTEVIVREMRMLDRRGGGEGPYDRNTAGAGQPPTGGASAPAAGAFQGSAAPSPGTGVPGGGQPSPAAPVADDFDDDIPF